MAGQDAPKHFRSDADPNADFNGAVPDPEVVAEARETWRAEVAFAEQYVAEAPDLEVVGNQGDVLREVLVHMIEEYARHNGHEGRSSGDHKVSWRHIRSAPTDRKPWRSGATRSSPDS